MACRYQVTGAGGWDSVPTPGACHLIPETRTETVLLAATPPTSIMIRLPLRRPEGDDGEHRHRAERPYRGVPGADLSSLPGAGGSHDLGRGAQSQGLPRFGHGDAQTPGGARPDPPREVPGDHPLRAGAPDRAYHHPPPRPARASPGGRA